MHISSPSHIYPLHISSPISSGQVILSVCTQYLLFGGQYPLDLPVPAYPHHNNLFPLILQVPTTFPAKCFDTRPLLSALHSVFGLAGEYPYLCSMSWSQLTPTT